jgi:hypothetical protein
LLHPEGNINNNPNLAGLSEILVEAGFDLHVVSPRIQGMYQQPPGPGVTMHLFDGLADAATTGRVFDDAPRTGKAPAFAPFAERFGPFHLVLGVDRGIIEAARVAQACSIPHALISYEIFFRDEAGEDFKRPEINACQGIRFAVSQDTIRSQHLSRENGIPLYRILTIPLAGRRTRPGPNTHSLHATLGIPARTRIALFIGGVSEMCCMADVIRQAAAFQDHWALVVHNRYGLTPTVRRYVQLSQGVQNIYFSSHPYGTFDEMGGMIRSADLGIAFYRMVRGSIYTGRNVGDIGMSSGKISTYLQHGLPVLTNEIGLMSLLVRSHQLGWVVDPKKLDLSSIDPSQLEIRRGNCLRFFAEKLDLDANARQFLSRVEQETTG